MIFAKSMQNWEKTDYPNYTKLTKVSHILVYYILVIVSHTPTITLSLRANTKPWFDPETILLTQKREVYG